MKIPPVDWWRTVFFLIPLIAIYTIVLGAASLISSLFDRRGLFAHRCARAWARLILWTTRVRVRMSGMECLEPHGTYVFVANHQSIYDIPIVFASLPFQLRIIAKASLGRFPFLGWHLRRAGHLLVDRASPNTTLFRRVEGLMRDGLSMIVFPEGTRSVDGDVGRFRGGIFLLAIETGLPIVPMSISGSRHVMRKGRLMACAGDVDLIIHPPVTTAGLPPEAAKRLAEQVRLQVRAKIGS